MAVQSERDRGYQLARAVILSFLWVLFAATLVLSAREGVAFAKVKLAERNRGAMQFAPGTMMVVDAERDAVPFGKNPKALRRYYLSFAVGGGSNSPGRLPGIVMLEGRIKVNGLDRDGNLVKVRIARGEHRDEILWVRRDRLQLTDAPSRRG